MALWVQYYHEDIYRSNTILKDLAQHYCDQDPLVQNARLAGATAGYIMGGSHYRPFGPDADWVYHWTVRFEPEEIKPVHVVSPLWGLPEHYIREFFRSFLRGVYLQSVPGWVLHDYGYANWEINWMLKDRRRVPEWL
ncbi:hypothetical protein EIP86_009078 [Pleurotus ostreatoroseus]|nr:hypothetical protein EIP86_009078 [Pleurotus ostreatoroseus]